MAFLQPGRGNGPSFGEGRAFNVPPVVFWTIGALVAAHLARVVLPAETQGHLLEQYTFAPARVLDRPLAGLPTFLTYMFLQFDASGLAVACLSVLAFGSVVAQRFGAPMFLGLLLLSGIVSAGFELAVAPHSPLGLGGAFGAVSGLIATAIRIALGPPSMTAPAPLVPLVSAPVAVLTILWLGLALLFPHEALLGGKVVAVTLWAPVLGGLAAGLALSSLFDLFVPRIDLGGDFDA